MKPFLNRISGVQLSALLAAAALILTPGCGRKETDVGGPGAVGGRGGDDEKGPDTFNLTLPSKVDIMQGESKEVTIGFEPGEDFRQSVKVATTPLRRITLEPEEFEFEGNRNEARLTIKVSPEAKVGEHKVIIMGAPAEGEISEGGFTVNVTAKQAEKGDNP